MLSSPDWKLTLDQPPSIPAVPKRRISCSAQPQSIPACRTTKYPCSAQPQSILTLPSRKVLIREVSSQCPTAKYHCSAQLQSIPAQLVPIRRVSLECQTTEYQYSCSSFEVLQGQWGRGPGKRYISYTATALGRGCSKQIIFI